VILVISRSVMCPDAVFQEKPVQHLAGARDIADAVALGPGIALVAKFEKLHARLARPGRAGQK
jgi:hypothetical protein